MTASLALASSYPMNPGDGTAPFIREICHGLVAHGVDVDLLIPGHPDLDWPEGDPPVRLHTHRYLPRRAPRDWYAWGYGGSLVADRRLRASTLALLPIAAVSAAFRYMDLAESRKLDVLHAHWLVPAGPVVAMASLFLERPFVVSLHGSGMFVAERNPFLRAAARFVLRRASRVTACSGDLAERAVQLGARPGSVSVIPYGVDTSAFRPGRSEVRYRMRQQLNVDPDTTMILGVGRLVAKKGFRHLIEAVAGVSNVELIVAGGGDLEDELRQLIDDSGLAARARLLGAVSHERVRDLYAAADILAVPSVVDEAGNVDGLPNVILEGMASGLAIVASRVAGIPQVIHHHENGWLVAPADPASLGSALERLSANAELRDRLGRAARDDALAKLRWEIVTREYARHLRVAAEEASQ